MYWGVFVSAIIYAAVLALSITLIRRGVMVGAEED